MAGQVILLQKIPPSLSAAGYRKLEEIEVAVPHFIIGVRYTKKGAGYRMQALLRSVVAAK